ncbi:BLUF domain-containing protein [Hymenobacter weizhouensis]|uniref:BLUF domain-containing protein n=1 Tax=Hymenobacter sp. YIM 151500-1 TaxID=2987689 RepID=UPI002227D843|nr:BLUF domain-containing protein [Hymenobacter sp. YIM 151500-1]UYZ64682.1 BLUF domain-containing protein [Hymenobacter sp. YIM 151500-1]
MHHIIYQSAETAPLSDAELRQLLQHWRAYNHSQGITGILLYSEGQFLQIIEGGEAEVQALFERIERNYRHVHVVKLADGPIPQRCFTEWSMGYVPLEPAAFTRVRGYLDLQQSEELASRFRGCDEELANLLRSFVNEQAAMPW